MNKKRNEKIFKEYQKKVTIGVLSKRYKISRQRVHELVSKIAKKKGVKLREKINLGRRGLWFNVTDEQIKQIESGEITAQEVADTLGCNVRTVRNRLSKGWRKRSEKIKHEKVTKRREEIHNRRLNGESYKSIAADLGIIVGKLISDVFQFRKSKR